MKIAVCIKQVPTRDWQPRLNEAKTWIREQDATFEMNEPDAYALEEALRLQGKAGWRSGGVFGWTGARRPGAARGAGPRRRSRDSRGRRRAGNADAFVIAERARRRDAGRAIRSRFSPAFSPTTRDSRRPA